MPSKPNLELAIKLTSVFQERGRVDRKVSRRKLCLVKGSQLILDHLTTFIPTANQ